MIQTKTPEEIAVMREGGRILAGIMEELITQVRQSVNTAQLDKMAKAKILQAGAKPAFLNYQGFPNTMCTSVNEEVVHAIPRKDKILREGDIITLDLGLMYKKYYLDMARTVPVDNVSADAARLMRVTEEALAIGTKKVKPNVALGDIGEAIQQFVEGEGFGVVRELCGHGIGRELHEPPQVLNFGKAGTGEKLKDGMVICIEPMVTAGHWDVKRAKDGQTFVTKDSSLAAHFEDTVLVTAKDAEILTRKPLYTPGV